MAKPAVPPGPWRSENSPLPPSAQDQNGWTDDALLAAFMATGDQAAFAEIASRHGAMVFRTCLHRLGNVHDAEDAAQAVFLQLAQTPGRARGSLGGWLHKVAGDTAVTLLRARARRTPPGRGSCNAQGSVPAAERGTLAGGVGPRHRPAAHPATGSRHSLLPGRPQAGGSRPHPGLQPGHALALGGGWIGPASHAAGPSGRGCHIGCAGCFLCPAKSDGRGACQPVWAAWELPGPAKRPCPPRSPRWQTLPARPRWWPR